jgi:hypothetical protein
MEKILNIRTKIKFNRPKELKTVDKDNLVKKRIISYVRAASSGDEWKTYIHMMLSKNEYTSTEMKHAQDENLNRVQSRSG